MRPLRNAQIWTIILASMVAFATTARANPPTIETCKKLQSDLDKLESSGIKSDIEKGPEWAKTNLPAVRINEILRYLKTFEQIEFRCEYVFALYEAQEERRQEAKKAREQAIANMPPLPVRRPTPPPKTLVSTSSENLTVIPPPKRPAELEAPTTAGKPTPVAIPAADKNIPKATQNLWETKKIDRTQ